MGKIMSFAFDKFRKKEETKILIVGLKEAGKSHILYKLKLCEPSSARLIGFSLESARHKNFVFHAWDLCGSERIRPIWKPFFKGAHGLIFVIDSNDRERIEEAKTELYKLLEEEELRKTTLLVFANKQDLAGAMNPAEVTEKLGLHTIRNRLWYVQGSSAVSGDGLYEGLDWLTNTILKNEEYDSTYRG
eukprot:TRINITY_DN7977_c0_g2_i1.p1 TRINITY_DN7977_c0_g2~~TRINITY_DN7977_c0_g2_i1.p1  ORF type:complete len:189 (+),score=29.72 TRINITY_DN7977_c0_g2_i1:28-594(+)